MMQNRMALGLVMAVFWSGCWKHETSAPHTTVTVDVRGENTQDIAAGEFADGWSVHYDRFSLSPTFGVDETSDNRKGDGYQPVVGEEAYVYSGGERLELTDPAAVPAFFGWVIAGRSGGWGMRLRSVPPATDEPSENTSLDVSGEATGPDGQVLRFAWQFTYELTFAHCLPVGEQALVLPEDGELAVHVALDGRALFGDQLAADAPLRFEALAQADADQDGTVTTAELRAAALDEIAREPEQYSSPRASNLLDFLNARLAYLVASDHTCQVSADIQPD